MSRLTCVVIAATLMLAFVATPASAAGDDGTAVAADVARILAANQGGRQLNATDVEVAPGVIMSARAQPGSRGAAVAVGDCTYKWLCLWSEPNWEGYKLSLTRCGWTYLQGYGFPTGGDWRDKVTSLVNNQTSGVVSRFYDSDAYGNRLYLGRQHAYGYRQNLNYDTAAVGGSWNDRMDDVWVC